MRKSFAKIFPVVALSALAAAACTDGITSPGDTAGALPVDTLLARAPVDTLYVAQRSGIDTLYSAQRSTIDTLLISAAAAPVDTLL